MKVMGIDPGTLCVGYGLLEEKKSGVVTGNFGGISIPGKKSIALRLKIIYENLYALLQEETPEAVAVEDVFYGKSVKSAIRIGEGRAVAMLSLSALSEMATVSA